jgi:hypothetical protein
MLGAGLLFLYPTLLLHSTSVSSFFSMHLYLLSWQCLQFSLNLGISNKHFYICYVEKNPFVAVKVFFILDISSVLQYLTDHDC